MLISVYCLDFPALVKQCYRKVRTSHRYTDTKHYKSTFTTYISFLKTNRQNSPSPRESPLRRTPQRRTGASFLPFGMHWVEPQRAGSCGCPPTPCGKRSASAPAQKTTAGSAGSRPPSISLRVPRTWACAMWLQDKYQLV